MVQYNISQFVSQVAMSIEDIIKNHQRIPGSILHAFAERWLTSSQEKTE